jgi:hypothetical protein
LDAVRRTVRTRGPEAVMRPAEGTRTETVRRPARTSPLVALTAAGATGIDASASALPGPAKVTVATGGAGGATGGAPWQESPAQAPEPLGPAASGRPPPRRAS